MDFPYKIDVFRRSACGLYFRILIAQIEYTHDEEYKHTKNGELADMTHGAVLTPENPEKCKIGLADLSIHAYSETQTLQA